MEGYHTYEGDLEMSDQGNFPQPEGTQPQGATPPPADAHPPAPQEPSQGAYQPMPGMAPVIPSGPAPARPKAMDTAVQLMRVGGGLSVVGIALVFLMRDSIRQSIEESLKAAGTAYTPSDVDTAVGIGVMFSVVLGLMGTALWFWMAAANGKGRSWARIVATVFFALYVLLSLFSLGSTTTTSMLASLVTLGVGAAALFFMYKRESTEWYRAMSAPRS